MAIQYEYYSILEIEQTATDVEIKKAYRKKAMDLHPDRHGGDKEKEAEFKKLNEAYATLSDPQKKAHYDRFGSTEGMGGFGGFGGGFDAGDLGDIFSQFFGGGFGGTRSSRTDMGEDIEIRLKISLEDAIRGVSRKIEYEKSEVCHHCNGYGGTTQTCDTCKGSGQVRERVQTVFGTMEQARPCGTCRGTGKKITDTCNHCHGEGKLRKKVEKTIDVPKGIENGMSIKLRGEGHEGRDAAGDLYVTFSVPHEEAGLVRDGTDLHYQVRISPAEAALGVTKSLEIPILGKKKLDIKAGTQSGHEMIFRGEGIESIDRGGRTGSLICHIIVETPQKLSTDQKRLYEALLQSEGGKVKKGWLDEFFR